MATTAKVAREAKTLKFTTDDMLTNNLIALLVSMQMSDYTKRVTGYLRWASMVARANIDMVDGNGKTCLMTAAQHGHLQVIKTCIELGADMFCVDRDGKMAKDWAFNHNECAEYLAKQMREKAATSGTRLLKRKSSDDGGDGRKAEKLRKAGR